MNRVKHLGSGGGDGRKTIIAFGVCGILRLSVMQDALRHVDKGHWPQES